MCDYSLQGVASRPAKVGDRLVTRQFNSFTTGFASVGEPNVAVCLLAGTEIAFDADIKIKGFFRSIRNLIGGKRTVEREARFRRVQPDQPNVHHDALELSSGKTVLLTRLCQGQHATVLQVSFAASLRPTVRRRLCDYAPDSLRRGRHVEVRDSRACGGRRAPH